MKMTDAISKYIEAGSPEAPDEVDSAAVPELLSSPPSIERAVKLAQHFERVRQAIGEAVLIAKLSKG